MIQAPLLESVKFVIDADGTKSAVLVGLDLWEEILSVLEDMEDAEEIRRARAQQEELIPWEQVQANSVCSHRCTGFWFAGVPRKTFQAYQRTMFGSSPVTSMTSPKIHGLPVPKS